MSWLLHLHLLAAIAWIGGSIFMFVIGITLTDKEKQKEVYPHVGPIFGNYELISLALLVITGVLMAINKDLLELVFSSNTTEVVTLLRAKLWVVFAIFIATVIHFYIAHTTNGKERTKLQNFLSRGSSLMILILNLFALHYAIMIRSIL